MWTGSGALFASSGPHLSVGDIIEDILSTPVDIPGPNTAGARRRPAGHEQRHMTPQEQSQREGVRRIPEVPAGKEAQLQGALQVRPLTTGWRVVVHGKVVRSQRHSVLLRSSCLHRAFSPSGLS